MLTYIKKLLSDESYAARAVKAFGVALGVYLATTKKGTWEDFVPAAISFLGAAIPSSTASSN